MAGEIAQRIWWLVRAQHGVIARRQLLEAGMSARAVEHRIATGRLHPIHRGIYAAGRPEISQEGEWMAAVLACGPGAALSHSAAAVLFGIRARGTVEVSSPNGARRPGIVVHRRERMETVVHRGIPVTTPAATLVDIAPRLTAIELERAINDADRLDLVHPKGLHAALGSMPPRPGVGIVRALLDRQLFTLTDSDLEIFFLPIAKRAGLPRPLTRAWANGFKVDFFWPDLGFVVETDGGRFHRTPGQQTRDRLRDQTHFAAGLVPLRFTHWQVRYDSPHVQRILEAALARLRGAPHL